MKEFKQYQIVDRLMNGGTQQIYEFDNGFSASVIRNPYSYGGDQNLWEIAVFGKDGGLTYETDVTSDVIGWLNEKQVEQVLKGIKSLDENGKLPENYIKDWEVE